MSGLKFAAKVPSAEVQGGSVNSPLISIVTPVYNAERFFHETYNSVYSQTHTDWEWILVDDCSADRSVELIEAAAKNDSRIRLVQLPENSGAGVARNAGTKLAQGRYLVFLDADDLWVPQKLEKQLRFCEKALSGFTFSAYEFADQNGKPSGRKVSVPERITYAQALRNTTIWTSTVMIDLQEIPRELCLMPHVWRGQDTATWWQILKHTGFANGLDEVLAFYRQTEGSLSSNKLVALKRTWRSYIDIEKLPIPVAMYNFVGYVFNAIRRRL